MSPDEAARLLQQAYNSSPRDEKAVAVQLPAVRYEEGLRARRVDRVNFRGTAAGEGPGPQIQADFNQTDYVELKHPGGTP